MKKRWVIISALLIGGLLLLAIVTTVLQGEAVPAIRLKRENVLATLTVTGEVRADTTVAFSPPQSARIIDITVSEGDYIQSGQLLVTLETDQALARLKESKARASQAEESLADVRQGTRPEQIRFLEERYRETAQRITQAQASLAAAQSQAEDARRNARRMQALVKNDYVSLQEAERAEVAANVAQKEVDRVQAELSATQIQRAQIAAQLDEAKNGPTQPEIGTAVAAAKAAQATVLEASARLNDYRVVSTLDGIVIEKLQDPGDLATPGQPILRAVKPETLEIRAMVEEADLAKVKVGDTAYITLDALPDKPLESKIRRLGSRVNPENGTVEVRVILTPKGWRDLSRIPFLPGMTADVNIITDRLENVLVLPAAAARQEGGQWFVYLFEGNRLRKKPIRAERISVENIRILHGLAPGDQVAAVATDNLLEKKRVRPDLQQKPPSLSRPPSGTGGITGGTR